MSSNNNFNLASITYDLNSSQLGWGGDFADYKIKDSVSCDLHIESATLPSNLSINQKAIKISGSNWDDNLFMFLKKKVSGLKPNADYTVVFEVQLASDAPLGIAKGDSVYLKVGAISQEPKAIRDGDYYRMNINKGSGYTGGSDMVVLGTIGTSYNAQGYSLIEKSNDTNSSNPYILGHTNDKGELWLIVGTDSMYKGALTIYYTSVTVVISISQ
ncbi:MAG TPA: hypothetical protein VIM65_11365 [Cyclobacteriaceae bacterium]